MNNKISFITELLNSKKIEASQKERLFLLTASELKNNISNDNEDIIKRIAEIEKKIGEGKIREGKDKNPPTKTTIKKHSPKTMVKFLYSFSIDEKFKWFTHNPEGLITEFDYLSYINIAQKEYKVITGWNINNNTFYTVRNFIFDINENNSNSSTLELTWKNLKKWCENNPSTHPYKAEINGKKFKRSIDKFKHIIEFRTDEADLTFNLQVRKHIRILLGVDFKPIFTNSFNEIGQSLNIFCDITLLFSAIQQILDWIVSNKSISNNVEINLTNESDFYQLEITHKKCFMSAEVNNEKLKGLSGDFDKVRKILFCVADWEIITTIKHNNIVEEIKIICLDSDTELINNTLTPNKIVKLDEISNNVKHILKLYKTQNL